MKKRGAVELAGAVILIGVLGFILLSVSFYPVTHASVGLPSYSEFYTYGVPIAQYDPGNPSGTLLDVPWQGVDVDELGLWGHDSTYFTVSSPGLYEVILQVGFTSTGPTPQFSRFHAGIVASTQRFEYATGEVQFATQPSLWLNVGFFYHITDPIHQFIYAQVESYESGNTQIAQARMQIVMVRGW